MPITAVVEPAWDRLPEELLEARGSVFLLGATDSGKSTLARHLLREMVARHRPVALVDADLGQSALGLPGTVSMKVFRTPEEFAAYRYERLSFIGSVNPVRVMALLVEETGKMADIARNESEMVLIDSTGLVTGPLGNLLKLRKIRRVAPALIVAIQSDNELGPILAEIDNIPVCYLKPSPMARSRSPEARARYRRQRLAGYFAASIPAESLLTVHDADFFHLGQPIDLRFAHIAAGTVIGLNCHDETVALGMVTESDDISITFRTPLAAVRGISRVVLGDFVLE